MLTILVNFKKGLGGLYLKFIKKFSSMKTSAALSLISISAFLSFLGSYFLNLTMGNIEQFLGILAVVMLDGFFGVCAGIKREGFKTYKALKVLRTLGIWWLILGAILVVEEGFTGAGWLSETIVIPFLVFELISALKNASMLGWINNELLNQLLDKIDKHKGDRQ
jgi:phage-related holin